MKGNRTRNHVIDVLFVLTLFGVFITTALIVAMMGADVYRGTVENMNKNFDTQTSLTYITTKIRQNDVVGGVYLSDFDSIPSLVLEQTVGEDVYQTWIYHHDGMLKEMFIKKGSDIEPDFGVAIMELTQFSMEERDGLFLIKTVDMDGNPIEAAVGMRT